MNRNEIIKQVAAERQRIRLHIETMKSTLSGFKRKAKNQRDNVMAYQKSSHAITRLERSIAWEERKLQLLEDRWQC